MKKTFVISFAFLCIFSGAQAAVSQRGTVEEAGQGANQGAQISPQTDAGEPTQAQA